MPEDEATIDPPPAGAPPVETATAPAPHRPPWRRKGTLPWKLSYASFWLLVAAGTITFAVCERESTFYEIKIRAGLRAADTKPLSERCEAVLYGQATVAETPLIGAAIRITTFDRRGVPRRFNALTSDREGRFTACIPVIPDQRGRIALSAALPVSALANDANLRWIFAATRASCRTEAARADPRCRQLLGTARLSPDGQRSVARRRTQVPAWVIVLGSGSLIGGMYGSILGTRRLGLLASIGVSLAIIVVALTMLGIIIAGYIDVLGTFEDTDVLIQTSIGYLTQGTYATAVPADWVFSLTLPNGDGAELIGFGAPLWTIVLGTLGACLVAFQRLVRTPFDLDAEADQAQRDLLTGDKADQLFAVAFAPLGSIFIYQATITVQVTNSLIVASTMLASGIALNHMVATASRRVQAAVDSALSRLSAALASSQAAPDGSAAATPHSGNSASSSSTASTSTSGLILS